MRCPSKPLTHAGRSFHRRIESRVRRMQPYSLPLERGQWIARRAIIRPAIVLLIFLAAGCIHDSEVVYHPDARVLLENGELAVASGAQTVLEVNRFKGRVLSDVATEYTFYLEIDTALIRSGTRLAIPSEGVRPHRSEE